MKHTSSSLAQTQSLANDLTMSLKEGAVVTLTGQLGAGKTSFSQGIGKALGITRMVSPTYILLKQYKLPKSHHQIKYLYHADLYRLSSQAEALDLGLVEIWSDPQNLLLIEWPEKILDLLPSNHIKVNIKNLGDEQREISIN